MNRFFKSFCLLMISAFASWTWAADESINIKFNTGSFDNATDYGCYPVKGSEWQIACNGDSGQSPGVKDGTITLKDGVSVHYSTSAHWTVATAGINTLLDAYLDDGAVGGHGTTITVSGLDTTMYANYDVLIYLSGDTTSPFRALTVNGTSYTAALGEGFAATAGSHYWGQCSATSLATPTIGVNTLYIKGLTATADANTLSISVNAVDQGDRANGRACIAALQIIPANAISDLETVTIPSFSNPSWRPEGEMPQVAWGDSPFATTAYGANTDAASTTSDGFTAQAVWLRGAQNTPIVFAGNDEATGGMLDKNLMLLVTGGDYNMIFGGSNSVRWQNSSAHSISGNIFVEMKGGTAKGVFGGNYKDGFSPKLTGDIDVLIDGDAQVSGVVAGGGVSAHNQTTTYGSANEPVNLNVTVKNVQTTTGTDNVDGLGGLVPNFIIGGPVWGTNTGGSHTVYGNTTAKVVLPSTASGEFVKAIVGAAVNRSEYDATGMTINGTSSVVIDAPNAVTFSKPIYGGALTTLAGTATVQNSSVTINGGTFTNTIYAGGDGNNSAVSGTATLTLNGGDFSAATVTPGKAAKSKLEINGDVDLSSTTVEAFDQMVIAQGKCLTLGTNRLLRTSLQGGGTAGWATLKITLTDNELSAKNAIICAYDGNVFPTIEYTNKPENQTWTLFVGEGKLCVGVRGEYTWTSGSTSWDEGLSEFTPGGDIVFGKNETEETVTIPRDIVAGDVKIQGAYKFQGAKLDALSVTLENGASLSLSNESVTLQYCRYIRLTPSNVNDGTGDNAYPGFAELILTQNGTAVAWPIGTTIVQKNNDSSETLPEWNAGGNEKVNALIDGVYGDQSANGIGVNPATNAQVPYNAQIRYNKWWPRGQQNASAVITLGSLITFDGYQLVSTDHSPRSPKNWTLEVSLDGRTWVTVDTQTNRTIPNVNSFYKYEAENSTFPVSSLAVPSQATVNALAINIAAGATLTMENVNAIGTTGNITGAGTLVCNGVLPTTAEQRITNANWRGKVVLQAIPSFTDLDLDEFGNADSVIELNGIGDGTNQTYMRHTQTIDSDVILTGDNWFTDGSSSTTVTFNGDISGDGAFKFKKYNGNSNPSETWIFNGAYNASIVNEDVTNRKIVFGSGTADAGKIVIAKNVTIATGMTWSAVNGIAIMDAATLTVNGAITGAIANAGVLVYAVDTTASNTFTGAGTIQVAAAKTVDLSAATLTSFTGTYSVGDGATLKLPLAATAEKSIALGTDAKLLVVLNDEQKGSEQSVTVTGGSVQFVDANGNVLCNGASYTAPIYTVGEGWTGANLTANANITIDFAETEGETVDLTAILGSVTTLSKLTVKGTNGGTITKTNEVENVAVAVTSIEANTIIEAGVATLGAVTIGADTVLTVKEDPCAITTSIGGVGQLSLDLGETVLDGYTIKADGGNYKVSSGTFTNTTLNISATKTTYEFAGGTITMLETPYENLGINVGQFSFGNADVVIRGGTIKATHLVTVQGGNNPARPTTITQTGGNIILSAIGDGSDTQMNKNAIMFGHWGNASSAYTLSGGSLVAENGGLRFGNDSPSTMEISGTGLLKVKGIKGKGEESSSLMMTGGKLSLGDWGFNAINNFTFTAEGGEINAYGNATINQGIALNDNVTLSADAGKTMTVTSAITGTATLSIDGAGIVDLSRATVANTIALDVKAGVTVVVAVEQLSTFAKVTIPKGATLKIKGVTADNLLVGRLNCTLGAESVINGDVVLEDVDGTTATVTDGVLSVTFTANPTLTGNTWWWDYEFNNSNASIGSDTGSMTLEGNGAKYTDEDSNGNRALYFRQRPYRSFSAPNAFTAVMYCQAGNYNNTVLVSFGTKTGTAVILATGANAAGGEMQILLNRNNVLTPLVDKLIVPNATTANHLYAFAYEVQAEQTVISVYVDGKLKKVTTIPEQLTVSDGFQIASVFGNAVDGLNGYDKSAEDGTIDFLRVTKGILSAEAMRKMAEVYKYESANGEATRTIGSDKANWVADATWTQSGQDTFVAQPTDGTNVTLTANGVTEVTVNLGTDVTYETVTVAGNATVTFKKGTAAFSAGDITIGTDVTIEYGAIDVDTLIVNGGKTLTFDFTSYDFDAIYKNTSIPLTGFATLGENATVKVALPDLPAYLSAKLVFNEDKEYALSITVTGELAAEIKSDCTWGDVTWKIGETEIDPAILPETFEALSVVLTAEEGAKLTLTKNVVLGSLEVRGAMLNVVGAYTMSVSELTTTDPLSLGAETILDLTVGEAVAGITKAIEGNGTIKVKLTTAYENVVNFTNFTGTTYVTAGCFSIDTGCLGSTLHLAGGVNVQTTKSTTDATLNIVLDGDTQFRANQSKPYTTVGSITGNGKLIKKGAATLTVCKVTTKCNLDTGNLTVAVGQGDECTIGQLSGSEGLTIQSGTVNLTAANGGYTGTITVAEGATLASGTTATCPFGKGTLVNNGIVILSAGQLPPTSGSGNVTIDGSGTAGELSTKIAGPLTISGILTVSKDVTCALDRNGTDFSESPVVNGPSLQINGTVNVGTTVTEGTITIASGKTLSGSGTIAVPVTFAENATIDATNGAVTVTGTVMYPESGAITVNATNYGDVLKAASPDATKFTLATGRDGLLVATNAALVYTAKPTLPENTTGVSDETIAEIAQMAAASEITNVTIEGAELAPAVGDTPAKKVDVAGLELFNNVPVTITQGENGSGTATISYAFGIQDITIDANNKIVVTAKVDKLAVQAQEGEPAAIDETPAPTFVKGVTVELYNTYTQVIKNGETETLQEVTQKIGSTTVSSLGSEVTIESTDNLDAILSEMGRTTGTLDLTVKVTNEQVAETLEVDEGFEGDEAE